MRVFVPILLFSAMVLAQTSHPACTPSEPFAPVVRMEGVTELVGDVVLTCNGGTPTPSGQLVPYTTITLTFNAPVTSRITSNGASEALLVIDEPTSSENPSAAQSACATPLDGCSLAGNGGNNLYNGSPGHPNIFQAQQVSSSELAWYNVPLDPPPANAALILRFTNLRVNANSVAIANLLQPFNIQATIAITGPLQIGLAAPTQTLATAQQGLTTTVQSTTLQQCGQSPLSVYAGSPATASVTFTEGFPGAFKNNTSGSLEGQTLAQWISEQGVTESGFIPMASAGLPAQVGAAQSGTAFAIAFQNLPSQIQTSTAGTENIVDSNGSVVGSVSAVNFATPLTSSSPGNVVNVYVTAITETETIKSFTIPFPFSGSASTLPSTVSVLSGFSDAAFPQTGLFATSSTSYPQLPLFGSLDSGIITPPEAAAFPFATVVDCSNATQSLTTGGQAPAAFVLYTSEMQPRVYNVPLLSNGPPVANLQIVPDLSATWLNATLNTTTTPATLQFTALPSTFANLTATLKIVTPAPVGDLPVQVTFNNNSGPWFTRYGFANSASFVPQAVAPGEPFLIGGENFAPAVQANLMLGSNGFVATTLGNTQVLFDGEPAPLQFAVNLISTAYVAGYVPFEIAGQATTNVQVVYNGVVSPAVTLNVLDAAPGLFTANSSGGGEGAILNKDYSTNSAGNGANPGDLVYIYGGGAGQTTPPGRTGGVTGAGAPVATLNLPVEVFIDGVQATDVVYAGPAPDLIEGVFQINVRIPANARQGALPVVVQVGDKVTQPGVTVYVN